MEEEIVQYVTSIKAIRTSWKNGLTEEEKDEIRKVLEKHGFIAKSIKINEDELTTSIMTL